MTKKFKKIDTVSVPSPSIENLKVANVDKKFDLKKRGTNDGANNQPKADSVNLSPTELEVQAYFNSEMSAAKEKYLEVERSYRDERNNLRNTLNLEFDIQSIKKMRQEAEAAVDDIFTMRKKRIDDVHKQYKETEKNYRSFQVNNELTDRDPMYPENLSFWHPFLRVVFVLSGIELFIGFTFFQQADTPLVSAGLATLTVFINVMMAGFAGHRMRYTNHVKKFDRWFHSSIGVIFFLLFISLIVYLAHLRAAIPEVIKIAEETGATFLIIGEAGKLAGTSFTTAPFSILENAFPTVFVGGALMFGVFTFFKGYKIEDEYPGYSELHKKLIKAKEGLIAKNQKMLDDISGSFSLINSRLEDQKENIQVRTTSFLTNIENHDVLLKKVADEQEGINKNFEACVGIYRQANIYTRDDDKPAPAYFSNSPVLDNDLLQSMSEVSESDKKHAETLKGHLTKVSKAYTDTVGEIQKYSQEVTKKVNELVEQTA